MKTKNLFFLLLFVVSSALVSCSDDDEISFVVPNVTIEAEGFTTGSSVRVAQDQTVIYHVQVDNVDNYTVFWGLNGETVSNAPTYKFVAKNVGVNRISATVIGEDGGVQTTETQVEVYGKYRDGIFVLNEGNMTTENGSVIFIDNNGCVTDSAYWKVNNHFIGNVVQDMFIADKKAYFISQNGSSMGGDGMLVVANAETLKKEAAYEAELSTLFWPTHVLAVDNDVYIRDNNGVSVFNTSTKKLSFVEGSKGAAKNRMALINDKVFVPAGKKIYVIQGTEIIRTIEMEGAVSGIQKSSDNQLWVSCTTNPAQINKMNATDYSVIAKHELTDARIGAGWGATPAFSAKEDTIYFSNASTKIYRHIFNQNKTEYLTDVKEHIQDAGIVYNNLAVHPKTGQVYFNTIKGYGMDFLINDITVFDFSGAQPVLKADYKNHTHFPAGIFFTDSFK